jgi:Ca2+-transporting ATPase
MTFVAVVAVVFSLILVNRTYSASVFRAFFAPNIALAAVAIFVAAVLSLTLAFEPVRDLFGFGGLSGRQIAMSAAAGAISLLTLEAFKLGLGRKKRR